MYAFRAFSHFFRAASMASSMRGNPSPPLMRLELCSFCSAVTWLTASSSFFDNLSLSRQILDLAGFGDMEFKY